MQLQSFENIEIILVDNFSSDQTIQIAKKYSSRIFLKGNERSSQRNYGARVAAGKYILYLDADMILSPNLVFECVKTCERSNIDALYIPEKIVGKGYWIKVRDFERSFYSGTVIDAVRFIRRELFLQTGGFDESLIGPEDWDFDRKIRAYGRTSSVQASLYHNEGSFNFRWYLQKKDYYADSIAKYVMKWGSEDPDIKKQIGVSYRLLGVFIENSKWQRLLRHPEKAFGMYLLRLMVAVTYLNHSRKNS